MDNRRKTIVINKPFQYQHSLLIAALTVLMVNGIIIFRVMFPGNDPLVLSTLSAILLGAMEFALVGGIWFASLRATHRIAGPVYVFNREIGKLGEGDMTARISLRKKDMFQTEGWEMNESIRALRGRIETVKGLTLQLQLTHDQGGDVGALVEKLNIEMSAFNTGNQD